MDRHPLHALYLGQNHGEIATIPHRAGLTRVAAPSAPGSSPNTSGAGRVVPAIVAGVVALVLVGKVIKAVVDR